jgi:hypothetical protein
MLFGKGKRVLSALLVLCGDIGAVDVDDPLPYPFRRGTRYRESAITFRAYRDDGIGITQALHARMWLTRAIIATSISQEASAHQNARFLCHSGLLSPKIRVFVLQFSIITYR